MVKKKGMGEQAPHFRPPKGRAGGGKQGVAASIRKQRIRKKEVLWKDLEQLAPLPPLPPTPNRASKHASASADTEIPDPALEEAHEDLLPQPRPPEQHLDLEICFKPELPARADLGPVLADLQLLMADLGSSHLVDNAAWPQGHYMKKMHVSLPPDQEELFRRLLRGKDPSRPGDYPMPGDTARSFIFSDLGKVRAQQLLDRAQLAQAQPASRREIFWIPYDPQLRTKATPARIKRILLHNPLVAAVVSVSMDDTRLSGGYTLKGLSTNAATAHVILTSARHPTFLSDPDGADPPTRYKHDASRHPYLCHHCHQSRLPCDPSRAAPNGLQPKWRCSVFRAQFPDLRPPDPKAITLDQLIRRSRERGSRSQQRPRPSPTHSTPSKHSRRPT
jgi:hypothetical protein